MKMADYEKMYHVLLQAQQEINKALERAKIKIEALQNDADVQPEVPEFNIHSILKSLSLKQPVFHSEAEFQLAMASEIKVHHPQCEINLEYTVPDLGYRLDLLVSLRGQLIPIELKYKTAKSQFTVEDETYLLKDHSAQDIGSYDIIKDIVRIEHILHKLDCPMGFTITLSNDPLYWSKPIRPTIADEFRLWEGRSLTGSLGWAEHAGAGSTQGREERLILSGEYPLHWAEYSTLGEGRNEQFRYLATTYTK